MPKASAAATAACRANRFSISSGQILLPPRETMSFERPTSAAAGQGRLSSNVPSAPES
jgi:hypothetical protein